MSKKTKRMKPVKRWCIVQKSDGEIRVACKSRQSAYDELHAWGKQHFRVARCELRELPRARRSK